MNQSSGFLYLLLFQGEMHELDLENMENYRILQFPKQMLSIFVPDMILRRSESEYRGDREKSAEMMMSEVQENIKELEDRENRLDEIIRTHFMKYLPGEGIEGPMLKKDPQVIGGGNSLAKIRSDHLNLRQKITGELNIIRSLKRANLMLLVEVHKKFSIPVACIVFVLVGAPLGIMSRKGNLAVAGGISFGFFLLYWATLIGGEELADNQMLSPFLAMWMANIIVGISGIILVLHAVYEATMIYRTVLRFIKVKKKRGPGKISQ
jgi:lipopolysaccharide export system permease protein